MRPEFGQVLGDAEGCECLPVDEIDKKHFSERRFADARDAGNNTTMRILKKCLPAIDARIRYEARKPQADALKMGPGIGKDTCMKHPLQHSCAREPKLEVLSLDVPVLRQ